MEIDLRVGDSLQILKELDADSIDSVVTDPPYGLKFMSKKWDYNVPTTELWKEVIRVLKPGGHLLSFSSARTYHRMAVAVEDAGFEIRDQIMYVYGSGFPKSHNIEKAIIKKYAKAKQNTEHRMRQVWNSYLQETKPTIEEQGQILFSFLQKQGCMQREATNWMEAFRYWEEQPKLEGRSYDEETKRQLQRHKVCPLSEGILADVPTGWLYPRAQISDGDVVKENANEDGSSTSRGPQSTQQLYSQLDAICDEWGTQALGMEQSLQSYKGFGTALKPAHEPICLARKPFKGTVVDNVIKYGTGGINIDKSRVGTEKVHNDRPKELKNRSLADNVANHQDQYTADDYERTYVEGRFPANFIHDGSEEVTEHFPQTAANLAAGQRSIHKYLGEDNTNDRDKGHYKEKQDQFYNDAGSASRYFKQIDHDPIVMARKPLSEKTVVDNVIKHGTGGINIDKSRVGTSTEEQELLSNRSGDGGFQNTYVGGDQHKDQVYTAHTDGRFPANLIHDGSDEVVEQFPNVKGEIGKKKQTEFSFSAGVGHKKGQKFIPSIKDDGSAARFFYCAKVSKSERNAGLEGFEEKHKEGANFRPNHMEKALEGEDGNAFGRWNKTTNNHPTVKPVKLMSYLVNLITPEGGTVLDPFMGSGSTGMACKANEYNFIGIELDEDYVNIAKARIDGWE